MGVNVWTHLVVPMINVSFLVLIQRGKKSGKAEVGSPKEPTSTKWTYFVLFSVIHSSCKVYFFLKLCQDNF